MGALMSASEPISFTVPGQPISKSRPRISPQGGMYNPTETKDAEELIQAYYRQAAPGTQMDEESYWRVDCVFYTANKAKRDLDNLAKLVLDALSGLIWKDDCRVWTLNLCRQMDKDKPRTEITVERQPDM
jgi:crossover junction endodeoxyribonuclease RusA